MRSASSDASSRISNGERQRRLIVEGKASRGGESWSFRDPCLLTVEVDELIEWLLHVAAGNLDHPQIGFLEPNLAFRFLDGGLGIQLLFSRAVAVAAEACVVAVARVATVCGGPQVFTPKGCAQH